MPVEIGRAHEGEIAEFLRASQREAFKSFYNFNVIWHEQRHDFVAKSDGKIVGAARILIAASLATVESLVVEPSRRKTGIGAALLSDAADVANYYNCHKMTVLVAHRSAAQQFFEACGYREEAVLPQHTFKLDMAVMRKFLL